MNAETPTHIDATGLQCPVPLMMLKQAVEPLPSGSVVIIDVTDPHAELDFEIWCERFGHDLETIQQNPSSQQFQITVRK